MAASASDLVRQAAPNFATTLAATIAGAGDATMTLATTTGLPTGTGITLVIDATDANGNSTPTVKETVTGVVGASDTITNLVRGLDGTTAQAHSTGANVVMWITANLWNDFADAFTAEHSQLDGTHDATKVGMLAGTQTFTGTKTFTSPIVISGGVNGTWSGWTGISGVTLTYSSNTAYGGLNQSIVSTSTDMTGYLSVGMKLQLTQTSPKYFFIAAITSTTMTLTGGTDYSVANVAISNLYFSTMDSPFGFPLDPTKWTARYTYTDANSTTSSTFVQVGSHQLSIPIGVWNFRAKTVAYNNVSGVNECMVGLGYSTSATSVSDGELVSFSSPNTWASDTTNFTGAHFEFNKTIVLTSATTYYEIFVRVNSGTSYVNPNSASGYGVATGVIEAVCAYL